MKKIMVFTVLAALYQTCLAQATGKNITLPFWVANNFQRDFGNIKNISWQKVSDIYVASFHTKLSEIMAYYESDGQLTGTGKTISVDDLPEELTKAIAREYGGYAIQRAVEYSPSIVVSGISGRENALGIYNGDRVLYFVEVTNGKFEKILKVSSSGYIDVLKSKEKI